MENILCCIPARFNSSRLVGKPLLKINNKTIIHHVYEKAQKLNINNIIILTDDERIYDEVLTFGGKCAIIKEECLNGTERIINYLKTINHEIYDTILNIQGDEPFINHDVINQVLNNYIINKPTCSTVCYKSNNIEEILSKSRGKVVVDKFNNILYCSRNVIPSNKEYNIIKNHLYNIHVGIFVYNKKYLLENFITENTSNQLFEDIEWLKIIEQGFKVNTIFTEELERGVDTIEDYNYLKEKYMKLDLFINNLKIKNLNYDPLRYCLNNNIINKDGLWLEFGVSYGGTLDLISEYTDSTVYGFDTFNGIDKIGNWNKFYSVINDKGVPIKVVQLDKYMYKKTGIIKTFNKNVEFIKGYFDETLSNFLLNKNTRISFIHIDCTFFTSTNTILNECIKYFNDEIIIVFNGFINFPDYKECEILAFFDLIKKYNINYEFIGMNGDILKNEDRLIEYNDMRKNIYFNKDNTSEYYLYNKSVAVKIYK